MKVDLTEEERSALLQCINVAIKSAPDAITTSAQLMPLVQKLTARESQPEPAPAQAD